MGQFDASFISAYKAHISLKSFLHNRVVQEVIAAIQMPIDEHDCGAELNILSEFYGNAIDFAAINMCFDDEKTAEVLNVAGSMVRYEGFRPADEMELVQRDSEKSMRQDFAILQGKLTSLRRLFAAEEIRTIAEYFLRSYISNLRLWVHALSGKHQTETKVVTLFVDSPLASLPLLKAVERIKLPKDEIGQDLQTHSKTSRKSTFMKGQAYARQGEEDRPTGQPLPMTETIDQQIAKAAARIEDTAAQREAGLEKAIEEARKKK
jgi:hypothetical protein